MVDPELHSPFACGAVAQDGWGNNAEAETLAYEIGGRFARGKAPLREVPERLLTADGFVDHLKSAVDFAEEAGVARFGNAPDRLQILGALHEAQRFVDVNEPR